MNYISVFLFFFFFQSEEEKRINIKCPLQSFDKSDTISDFRCLFVCLFKLLSAWISSFFYYFHGTMSISLRIAHRLLLFPFELLFWVIFNSQWSIKEISFGLANYSEKFYQLNTFGVHSVLSFIHSLNHSMLTNGSICIKF